MVIGGRSPFVQNVPVSKNEHIIDKSKREVLCSIENKLLKCEHLNKNTNFPLIP
jgi:hypothetical protein